MESNNAVDKQMVELRGKLGFKATTNLKATTELLPVFLILYEQNLIANFPTICTMQCLLSLLIVLHQTTN
jgi:hypothetical protein